MAAEVEETDVLKKVVTRLQSPHTVGRGIGGVSGGVGDGVGGVIGRVAVVGGVVGSFVVVGGVCGSGGRRGQQGFRQGHW